jgi:hypothetical protein
LVYVLSGDKDPDVPGVDYFLEGVFRIHRRHLGPWPLKSLTGDSQEFRYRLSMVPVRAPDAPVPLSLAQWYSRDELRRYFASGQNFNPLPTGPDYKARLDDLLAGYGSNDATELIEDLFELANQVPDATERDVLAKARIGQGKFRADLVAAWRRGERCALTGVAIPEMLAASHIKPWRKSTNRERLDPMNGLLLVAHLDRLFDRHLASFREHAGEFRCVVHPRVGRDAERLGVSEGMPLDTSHLGLSDEGRFRGYMKEHLSRHSELVARDKPST